MTTIARLLAKAHVFRDTLGARPFTNARKALLRIADAASAVPASVPVADALAAYDAATADGAVSPKQRQEERTHLGRLLALPDLDEEMADRIFTGTATLADAQRAMRLVGESGARRSAVQKVIGHLTTAGDGADLPARQSAVERALARLTFTGLGVTPATFGSYKSAVRRAAGLVDMHGRQSLKASMLTGDWAALIARARDLKTISPRSGAGHHEGKLWPLVRFCHASGIPAADVCDATIAELRAELERDGIADPKGTTQAVVYAWEAFQRLLPDVWPARQITRVYAKGRATFKTPFAELPAPLRRSWDTYAERIFATDGAAAAVGRLADLVPDAPAPAPSGGARPLDDPLAAIPDDDATATDADAVPVLRDARARAGMRTSFTYLANAACEYRGRMPERIEDLFGDDAHAVMKRAIRALHANQQRAADARGVARPPVRNATTRKLVSDALAMARDLARPPEIVAAIDRWYDHVHPQCLGRRADRATGESRRIWDTGFAMSARRQAMIAAFGGTGGAAMLASWHRMPRHYHEKVKAKLRAVRGDARRLSLEDLNDAATAVVAAVVRCGALRRGSLERLRLADHPGDPACKASLYIPARLEKDVAARFDIPRIDVKKRGKPIRLLADPRTTEILIWFRDRIRPELLRRRGSDPGNPHLFPGAGLDPRPEGKATRDYRNRARKLGFDLDLHANRALIGKVVLDRDPSAMGLVQQALGHARIETTQRYYAAVNSLLAQQVWQAHVAAAERETMEQLGAQLRRLAA